MDIEKIPQYALNRKEEAISKVMEFEIFRKNLVVLRASKTLTAGELSTELGINAKRVSDYETGRIPPSFIHTIEIAKYFGITLDELLYKPAKVVFQ